MKDIPALAFPHKWETTDGTTIIAKGMTLRDYFAAKAMQALIPSEITPTGHVFSMAVEAYSLADEMIKAREL
jgi:hypothetical protein